MTTPAKKTVYRKEARRRFKRLVKLLGGATETAKALKCSVPMVSLVCSGVRNPGLRSGLAARVEHLASKLSQPSIPSSAWV